MGLDEAQEKRHASDRYVKANYGLWAGREVMPWYVRFPLAPLYALQTFVLCLKGVPVNLQILTERDYEPDEEPLMKCPQCREPLKREIDLDFTVGQNDNSKE